MTRPSTHCVAYLAVEFLYTRSEAGGTMNFGTLRAFAKSGRLSLYFTNCAETPDENRKQYWYPHLYKYQGTNNIV